MRIALVVHGFPPHEFTGVENHVAELARALAARGERVFVLAPRRDPRAPNLSIRVEARDGYRVHWIALNELPVDPRPALERRDVARVVGALLDREKPEIVHVHHLAKLGLGLVDECKRRSLPLVFTAHDYFALCHRTTLLKPDLTRCETLHDPAACARCDRAVELLNSIADLGDYQAGVAPRRMRRRDAARLQDALRASGEPSGEARRRELDELRRQAFRSFDVVLAPSRLVAERLAGAGIDAHRIRPFENAIDVAALAGVAAPLGRLGAPLRFGYVGSLAKHKGVDVLIEAFRPLRGRAELHLHGDTSDRAWRATLAELASDAGAIWHGRFDASARRDVYAALDALCVPSIWDENAPLSIRESFAAGRPVLASRVGALEESVRDHVDGMLIEPGDVDAWRATLEELVRDRGELARLARGVRPPRAIEHAVDELVELYRGLIGGREPRLHATMPASVAPFARRHAELAAAPLDELARLVARGLSTLRAGVGLPSAAPAAFEVALARLGDRAQAALREAADEARHWREAASGAGEQHARELEALREENRWLAELRASLEQERDWLRATHRAFDEERRASQRERDGLSRDKRALASELAWRREAVQHLERERDWLRATVASRDQEVAALRAELEARTTTDGIARRSLEEQVAAARRELDALTRHERWLAAAARALAASALSDGEGEPAQSAELAALLERARAELDARRAELEWRRAEMRAAQTAGGGVARAVIGRSGLGRRMRAWRERDAGDERGGGDR